MNENIGFITIVLLIILILLRTFYKDIRGTNANTAQYVLRIIMDYFFNINKSELKSEEAALKKISDYFTKNHMSNTVTTIDEENVLLVEACFNQLRIECEVEHFFYVRILVALSVQDSDYKQNLLIAQKITENFIVVKVLTFENSDSLIYLNVQSFFSSVDDCLKCLPRILDLLESVEYTIYEQNNTARMVKVEPDDA